MRAGNPIGYIIAALVGGIVGGLIAVFVGGWVSAESPLPARGPATTVERVERVEVFSGGLVEMVDRAGPAVASIDTLARVERRGFPFPGFPSPGPEGIRRGQGSGFIIDSEERLAVTNNHVVEGADRIRLTLPDERTFQARVIGRDPIADIALLKVEGSGDLPEIDLGDSDRVRIGEVVVAIGNPLGLGNTVTQGVLSAVGRRLPDSRVRGIPLEDLIQTDAAINPGNSGGPLLNSAGQVVGMNTAIIPQAQGLGFAVASNVIRRSVESLREHGRVIRPWLGVSMANLTPEVAEQVEVPRDVQRGALILAVQPDGPAARAGIEPGDVITGANDQPVERMEQLRDVITSLEPGKRLTLSGYRGERRMTWTVALGEMPPVDELTP